MTELPSAAHPEFIEELSRLLGAAALVTDAADIASYCVDWRREFGAPALCVARPKTVADVASIVRSCGRHGIAIVPQGGNTGLAGGAVPLGQRPQIVVSLARMNRIRSLDALAMTMEVEAGCVLQTAQQAAAARGLLLPVSYAAEGSAQIGGAIATNAGGINVLRYGMMRQRVLGLEAVLADGSIVDGMRRLAKDNAGYDWKQVFIGSEGTLGIVTAAAIKLVPRPKFTVTAWLSVSSLAAAMSILGAAGAELGDAINAFELMSQASLDLVGKHFGLAAPAAGAPWSVLIEGGSSLAGLQEAMEALLAGALERGDGIDGVIATSDAQAKKLWALREHLSEAELKEGRSVKHDVSVPVDKVADFITAAQAALLAHYPQVRLNIFGHAGDGNVHFNVLGAEDEQKHAINRLVHDVVGRFRGSISAEHGVGCYRVDELERAKSGSELALMRAIKLALDPGNLLNPGKVIHG